MTKSDRLFKRAFDIVFSFIGLLLVSWILVIAVIAATIDTRCFGIFSQLRYGYRGKLFRLYKIRTMVESEDDSTVTVAGDPRVTELGKILRKTKIDEIPQLFNVLIGEMSFVGPRPDMPEYRDKLSLSDEIILSVRPGVTGPASLKYRDEEEILAGCHDPHKHNDEVIFPDKVRINCEYVSNYSFRNDVLYIFRSIFR